MLHQQSWTVTLNGRAIGGAVLNSEQQMELQHKKSSILKWKEMGDERTLRKQVLLVNSYFSLKNVKNYLDLLGKIRQIFNLESTQIDKSLEKFKDVATLEERSSCQIPLSSRKLTLCYSKNWRKRHSTIFLVIRSFQSKAFAKLYRVAICDDQGYIMHMLTNMPNWDDVLRFLKNNYALLQSIVIIYPSCGKCEVELDLYSILLSQIKLQTVAVFAFGKSSSDQPIKIYRKDQAVGLLIIEATDRHLIIYNNQIASEDETFVTETASRLARVELILTEHIFNNSVSELNQRQIALRLFSYYFNLIVAKNMLSNSDSTKIEIEELHQTVQFSICKLLHENVEKNKSKKHMIKLHFPGKLKYSVICAVCSQRKPKYKCIGCSIKYHRNFALCPDNCFKEFHQNPKKYIDRFRKLKANASEDEGDDQHQIQFEEMLEPNKLLAHEKKSDFDEEVKKQEILVQNEDANSILEKWDKYTERNKQTVQQFQLNCQFGIYTANLKKQNRFFFEKLRKCQQKYNGTEYSNFQS